MFTLALRTLRFRMGGFVASFVALFFGGIIVMACGGLMETGIRSAVPPQRLAVAPIVVTADRSYAENGRIDAGLVGRIQTVPGVAKAVPDVSFPAIPVRDQQPVATGAAPVGHGWASAGLAPYILTAGSAPDRPGEVVLDAALAVAAGVQVGDRIEVAVGGRTQQFSVTGAAESDAVRGNASAAVFFAEPDARRLAGTPGRIDSIGVLVEPGADIGAVRRGVEAVLAGQAVSILTGDDRGLAEFSGVPDDSETLIALAGVFGGLAVTVAVFVVASTLALSVQQRYREMALLRAIGATPGQVRRMVLVEAMVVAVLATASAWPPNAYVGEWLFGQLTAHGVVSSAVVYHQGRIPMLVGVGVALLTALGAASIASRGAARARPTDALVEASLRQSWLSWIRVLFALLCLGGGLALAIVTATVMTGPVAASTAGPMAMLWASGLALLGPGVTGVLTAVLRWPLRAVSGQAGHLAMQNAGARPVRLAGAVIPIMLATGLATAFIYMQTAQTRASERVYTDNLRADAALTSAAAGFPIDLVNRVRTVPDVAAASALVPSTGYFLTGADPDDPDPVPVLGVTADGAAETTAISATAGSLSDLRGQTIALATTHAASLGRTVGQTMRMRLGDGTEVDLKVVALFTARPGYEIALLPAPLVVEHTTSRLVPQILVHARPGTDPTRLAHNLSRLADRQPGLRIANRQESLAGAAQREQTGAWVNYLLIAMILAYSAISLVNTLVVATGERRREFALQRLIGSTRGQIMRMLLIEAILITAGGVVLGTAVALWTLAAFGMALTGSPSPDGPLWIYFAVIGAVAALALTSTLLTGRLVLRSRPVHISLGT